MGGIVLQLHSGAPLGAAPLPAPVGLTHQAAPTPQPPPLSKQQHHNSQLKRGHPVRLRLMNLRGTSTRAPHSKSAGACTLLTRATPLTDIFRHYERARQNGLNGDLNVRHLQYHILPHHVVLRTVFLNIQ